MAKQLNVNLAFTADTNKARQELMELQKQLRALTQDSAQKSPLGLTKEITEAISDVTKLEVALKNATSHTGSLDLGQFRQELNKAGLSAEQIATQLSALGPAGKQAFSQLTQSISTAEIPLKRTSTLLTEFATTLKNTARWQISSSVLHGFMGSLQTAFYYAQDLNESLNNIRIVTGNSVDEMAKFAQEANKAAQALNTTTTEYTNASLIYYQQGLSDAEVKERTDVTVKMANVARESAETVSQQMTAVWNNFDDGSKSLEYYADVMTALGAATASSTDEIAEGLEKFAAVADTVGLSYEYATAALATVTATTRQSADVVGNAFKTLFARLEGLNLGETLDDGTDLNKYSSALLAVGINIKDVNGEMKGMDQILDELGGKWNTLAKDQQIALAQTVAGVRQYTQLIALMDNWDFFQSNLGVVADAEGTLQEQADIYAESWEAARDRVTAAAEEIYAQLLNDDFFIDLNNGFATILNTISNVIDTMGGLKGIIPLVGTLMLRAFGSELATSIDNIKHNIQLLTTAGQEAAVQTRMKMIEALRDIADDSTYSGIAQSEAFNVQADLQEQLIRKSVEIEAANGRISESQQAQIQHLMDINNQLGQAYINTAKQREEQEALSTTLQQQMRQRLSAGGGNIQSFNQTTQVASGLQQQYAIGTRIVQQFYTAASQASQKSGVEQQKALHAIKEALISLKTNLDQVGVAYTEFETELNDTIASSSVQELQQNLEILENVIIEIGGSAQQNFDSLEQALVDAGMGADQAASVIRRLQAAEEGAGSASLQEAQSLGNLRAQADQTSGSIAKLAKENMTLGQSMTALAQNLMTFSMLLSTIQGIVRTLEDEDMSGGEKFISILSSVAIVAPMVIQSASTLGPAITGLAGALGFTSAAAAGVGASLAAMAAAAAPVIAIVAVLGIAIYALVKAYNADADAAKQAAAEAEGLAKEYENVKSAYDDLKASLEDYNGARDALDELTKGTQEWKEAVIELNSQVLDLLDKYPQLAQYITSTNDGLLEISKIGQQALLDQQMKTVQDAYQANLMGQSRKNTTQDKSNYTDLGRNSYYYDPYSDSMMTVASSAVEKVVEAINEQGNAILENSDALADATGISKEQAQALLANKTELINLAAQVKANTEVNKLYTEQLGKSLLEERGQSDIQYADQIATLVGQKAQSLYNDEYYDEYRDKWFGKTDKDIQQQYADLMGYEWRANKNDNKGEYLVNGEIVEIADEVARAALAQEAAQEAATESIQAYSNALTEVANQAGSASGAILNAVAGISQGIEDMTLAEAEAFTNFDVGSLSEETLNALEISAEDLQARQAEAVQDWSDAVDDIKDSLLLEAKSIFENLNLDDVTINGQKAIAEVLNRAVTLGSQDAIDMIQSMLEDANVDSQEFAKVLGEIDWDTITVDEFRIALQAVGVSIVDTDEDLQALINTMSLAEDSVQSLTETYAAIHDIIDGLEVGDTISEEDYQTLGAGASSYFTMMMDGTYKLTGDAKEFYKLVQGQQIGDFRNQIDKIQQQNDNYSKIQGYDIQGLSAGQYQENISGTGLQYTYDTAAVEQQLEILETFNSKNIEVLENIQAWKDDLADGEVNHQMLDDIAEAVSSCSEQFAELDSTIATNEAQILQLDIAIASSYDNFRDLREALEDGTISLEAFNTAAVNLDKIKDIENLDADELKDYADYLQEASHNMDGFNNSMSDNEAKIVAKGIMKMNDAIDELANNWENWLGILEDSTATSEEYAEAMTGMRDAVADLLDISSDYVSSDFIKEHLDEIALAAKGDAEAIDDLKASLADEVIAKIILDNSEFIADVNEVQSLYDSLVSSIPDVDVGVTLSGEDEFINALNNLISATGMTVDQVNALCDSLGFEANFENTEVPTTYQVPLTTTQHTRTITGTDDYGNPTDWTESEQIVSSELVPYEGSYTAFAISTNGETPTITGVTKKASGSSNNYSSSNKGGTAQPGGKSKSGGGSKEKSKDTKDHKEFDDEIDRYWDINNAIKDTSNKFEELSDEMKKTQTVADHLFGKALINNLKQQNAQLERENALVAEQRANYQKLYEIQSGELAELESKLSAFGGQFAGDALTNYTALLQQGLAAYNAAIDAYNASAQEDADKQALEAAEKRYNELKTLLDRYQTLYYNEMADTQDKLRDLEQQELENRLKILENNLKAWEIEIELKLDVTKAKRDWNEFLNQVEQDFRKVYSDLTIDSKFNKDDFDTYIEDVDTTIGAIRDVEAEIDKMKNGGSSDMFYDISEAQEKLKELQEELIEQGKSLNELYQQVWDNYIDGMDQVEDKFEDIMDQYERIDDELEYEKELIELLYGDKAYDLMDKYYKAQEKNILGQIDSLKTQVDFWQSEFDKAYNMNKDAHNVDLNDMSTWTEDMRKAYENMQNAQANLNDLILEGVRILQDEYLNAINQVIDTMDKNIWGMSLDDLQDDWDHIQNLASEYLDDVEGAYKIQTLANKIDKSIADTSSLKAQQKLQKLREEEIAMLREKENLTQDDIDLAEARYQIALKEIALEEAQSQKTSMKLTRDTSGNWTYQYVADEEDILTKQQELLDAYNTLYETADEAYAHAMELAMETYETMQEKIREIAEDMTLSEEEKMQRIQEIYDTYLPEIEAAVGNSELYRQEAMAATAMVFAEVCEQDESAYETLTDKQKELVDTVRDNHLEDYEEVRTAIVDEMYPEVRDAAAEAFKETNLNSQTAAADIIHDWAQPQNAGSVRSMIDAAIDDMQKHIQNYEAELDKLQQVAGVDFGKLGDAIDKTTTKTDNLNDATEQLASDSAGYLDTLRSYVDEVADAWDNVIDKIMQAKSELEDYLALQSSGGGNSGGSSGGGGNTGGGGGSGGTGGNSGGGGKSYSSSDVEGIAGNIWVYGDWGNNPTRKALMIQKFGESNGTALYNAVQAKFNSGYGYNGGLEHDYAYYKNYSPSAFESGGYTGDWDSSGKLGILHQKELVLNADDTVNMLQAVQTIRDLTQLNDSISSAIAASIGQMALSLVANGGGSVNGIGSSNTENQFYITAEFPNANDVETIREAILTLPNLASQYIHQQK